MTNGKRRFHRLSTKFICGTAAILALILAATLFVNSKVAARYYLRQQTAYVSQAGSRIREYLDAGMSPDEAVASLEGSDNVLITYAANTSDYDALSSSLRDKFREKGLGFQKFWLWDQDYLSAVQKGSQFRLYQQDKLNYGILVEYIPVGSNLYAITAIIPNTADFIGIINRFSILLHVISLIIAVVLLYLLVKHITNPLRRMERFSQEIAHQEYGSLHIRTRDELEHVAAVSENASGQKSADGTAFKRRGPRLKDSHLPDRHVFLRNPGWAGRRHLFRNHHPAEQPDVADDRTASEPVWNRAERTSADHHQAGSAAF